MQEQVRLKAETGFSQEQPMVDFNRKAVEEAKSIFNGFLFQKPIKEFLVKKNGSRFLDIAKGLSVDTVTEVSVASGKKSGKNIDAYSVSVVTKDGPRTMTLAVDDTERLSLSVRKGGKDVILEMLIYKKGEIDYQKA